MRKYKSKILYSHITNNHHNQKSYKSKFCHMSDMLLISSFLFNILIFTPLYLHTFSKFLLNMILFSKLFQIYHVTSVFKLTQQFRNITFIIFVSILFMFVYSFFNFLLVSSIYIELQAKHFTL